MIMQFDETVFHLRVDCTPFTTTVFCYYYLRGLDHSNKLEFETIELNIKSIETFHCDAVHFKPPISVVLKNLRKTQQNLIYKSINVRFWSVKMTLEIVSTYKCVLILQQNIVISDFSNLPAELLHLKTFYQLYKEQRRSFIKSA